MIDTEPKITEGWLPKFSVGRPVTIVMIFVAILVIGFIAYSKIKLDLLPTGLNVPFMRVYVPYRNANPKEIEEQIAKPMEEELKTTNNVRTLISNSNSNGTAIFMEFAQGSNMDLAYTQVADRVERARLRIPSDVEQIYVTRRRENDIPSMAIGISYDKSVEDPHYVIETHIKKVLEGINGVANVELNGLKERYIQILLDDNKIKTYGINLYELVQRLMADNFTMSNGYVYMGKQKYLLRSQSKFTSLDSVRKLEVRKGLHLSDIADVVYDFDRENRYLIRVNNHSAANIIIFKESAANSVEVCNKVREKLSRQKKLKSLKGVDYFIFWDQGKAISESIENLEATGMWGGLFAFLVLLYFLRQLRVTILLAMAIPLSLVVTVITLYFMGWTLNTITMMGMMLSIGLVVDNSIVITENIYRFKSLGYNTLKSSVLGASEVSMAITLATFTTIVVFLPLMLMGGGSILSFYMIRIGTPVIIAILASLLVALVFIPLSASKVMPKKQDKVNVASHNVLVQWYQNSMVKILKHRTDAVIVIVLIILSSFVASSMMKSGIGGGGMQDAFVAVDFPRGYSVEKKDETLAFITKKIMERDDVYHVENILAQSGTFGGFIRIYLEPQKDKQWYEVLYRKFANTVGFSTYHRLSKQELADDIKKHVPELPGIQMRTSFQDQTDDKSITYTLSGYDTAVLQMIGDDLQKQLVLVDGVISIEDDIETGNDEIHLVVDRDKAFKMGTNPNYLSRYVAFNLRKQKISNYQTPEKEIPVYVMAKPEQWASAAQLKNARVKGPNNVGSNLASIADVSFHKGMGSIRRQNGKTTVELKIYSGEDDTKKLTERLDRVFERYNYPTGYSYRKGRKIVNFDDQGSEIVMAVVYAVIFVIIIMGILFESFILPLSVLISIPAAFVGSFWLVVITGTTFELLAGIGMVILVGVVVNNAIVLIDLINQYRKTGMNREQAILVAGVHRFRPILMTALTTIFGLVPMALGNATLIGSPYSPMGITMIGGLISSTFLTLFAVPVFYTYFDDLSSFLKKVRRRT
ncbi:MAG: efflux RND transporter permease subunit [bacterium]|nr:efflux RND transporter permease subunit [bacterium]